MSENNAGKTGNGLFSKSTVVACIALSVIGFLIYTGHGAHLMGYAPYLFILACPLMHIFMHHGHHHHEHNNADVNNTNSGTNTQKGDR